MLMGLTIITPSIILDNVKVVYINIILILRRA